MNPYLGNKVTKFAKAISAIPFRAMNSSQKSVKGFTPPIVESIVITREFIPSGLSISCVMVCCGFCMSIRSICSGVMFIPPWSAYFWVLYARNSTNRLESPPLQTHSPVAKLAAKSEYRLIHNWIFPWFCFRKAACSAGDMFK